MADIKLRRRHEALRGRHRGRQADEPRDRGRRVHDPRRPVGLREVDGAADDRRARGHLRGRAVDRRPRRQRPRAARPRHRDGLPELRAVPAHDGARRTWASRSSSPRCRRRRSTRRSRRRRASSTSTEHLDRKPANLSGGQRQRVAMGRAIVRDPQAFLMDEPLSNLDAKLRVQMRTEVSRLQQRLGTTTVYVTHDQTEAMTLGDRVAVMRVGRAPAGRHAARALRRPGQPLRRRLHRLAGDELLRRRPSSGAQDQAAVRRGAAAGGRRRTPATSSSASAPRTSRTPPSRPPGTRRASSSTRRSTSSSRWARRSTCTSPSRAAR